MVRRRESRVRTVLPVRIFGMDSSGKPFTALAHTLDITNSGARLAGISTSLTIGEIVGIQRGTDKARFRVAWVGEPNTRNAGQIGVECVQDHKNIWNFVFAEAEPDNFDLSTLDNPKPPQPTFQTSPPTTERRHFTRFPCDLGMDMQVEDSDVSIFARCTDISRGGCYVETHSPISISTRLFVCLKTERLRVRALAEVRSCHPSMGMGLRFVQLGDDDLQHLLEILQGLETTKTADVASGLLPRLQESVQSLKRLNDDIARYTIDPSAVRITQFALGISCETLDCCRRTLQDHPSAQFLTQALFVEQVRALTGLVNQIESNLVQTPASPSQLRAFRAAAQSLLEKLPDAPVAPAFDMPFIVTSSRQM
jgi:hypothetical protein